MNVIKYTFVASTIIFTIACQQVPKEVNEISTSTKNINFLAFGDGGYSVDYPKKKHIETPRNRTEFIEKERADWLEDYRPLDEFNHSPIHVYPKTGIATEASGAIPVGVAMSKLCQQRTCDFGIQLGDNIYPDGADALDGKNDQKRMNDLILAPLLPLFDQEPELIVYSALGNHDWKTSRKGVKLQTSWMSKQKNFYMSKQGYYRYRKGDPGNDIEFFVLDTNMLLSGQKFYDVPLKPDGSEENLADAIANGNAELDTAQQHEGPKNDEDKAQMAWLKQGLATSTAKWKIVYGHHILWSIGGSKYSEGHALRKLIMPSLCQYADAYIAGHEHDLELLTDDCSTYLGVKNSEPLPLIISGAASKMRGKHTPLANYQEKAYPQYELIWSKSFVWGFAHININNIKDELAVDFFTTPRNSSGQLAPEYSHRFKHRSK
jgi:hypothetical protein